MYTNQKNILIQSMNRLYLFLLVFSLCSCSPEATVVKVYDGDSITLSHQGVQHKIRLKGIDAPELKQSYGQKAKELLKNRILNKKVQFKIFNKDRYDREIAEIWLEGQNIGFFMVENGAAWQYTQYSKDSRLSDVQLKAKRNRIGLWQNKHPIPPWEWRKNDKN